MTPIENKNSSGNYGKEVAPTPPTNTNDYRLEEVWQGQLGNVSTGSQLKW